MKCMFFVCFTYFLYTGCFGNAERRFASLRANLNPRRRIIGGHNTTIERYPFIVAFEINGRQMCAGSLITTRTILTAAHCTSHPIEKYRFRIGSSHRERNGITRRAIEIINHPYYRHKIDLNNDIAVIILEEPVPITSRIQPIQMANGDAVLYPGDKVTVIGWGYTISGVRSSKPNRLNAVNLRYIDYDECAGIMGSQFAPGMMCAGNRDYTKDACTSDSGGPLIHNGILYGVVSWGKECADEEHPGVYTSVAYFRQFIDLYVE